MTLTACENTDCWAPLSSVSDTADLRRGLRIYISKKFPNDSDVAGLVKAVKRRVIGKEKGNYTGDTYAKTQCRRVLAILREQQEG